MRPQEAASQIREIHQRLADTHVYQGYRPVPTAASGLLAIGVALLQPWLVPEPLAQVEAYVALWGSVACFAVGACVMHAFYGAWFRGSTWQRELALTALARILPALVTGAVLTWVLITAEPTSLPLLPGLWAVLFSQALFASGRLLPREIKVVAAFYLAAGAVVIAYARSGEALAPWMMGATFGIGQLGAAVVLYTGLRRGPTAPDALELDDEEEEASWPTI